MRAESACDYGIMGMREMGSITAAYGRNSGAMEAVLRYAERISLSEKVAQMISGYFMDNPSPEYGPRKTYRHHRFGMDFDQ